MKSVFIVYNQALTERVSAILDSLGVKGFTRWQDVQGRGSAKGEPHFGTHTWPAMNSSILTVVDDQLVEKLLDKLNALNSNAEMQGLRAFVWNIEATV